MSLKTQIISDIDTFLNLDEFGETRTVKFDNLTFADINVVVTREKENYFRNVAGIPTRRRASSNRQTGIFMVTAILYCKASDLNGNIPEQGTRLQVSDAEDETYFTEYYVSAVQNNIGMIKISLEDADE